MYWKESNCWMFECWYLHKIILQCWLLRIWILNHKMILRFFFLKSIAVNMPFFYYTYNTIINCVTFCSFFLNEINVMKIKTAKVNCMQCNLLYTEVGRGEQCGAQESIRIKRTGAQPRTGVGGIGVESGRVGRRARRGGPGCLRRSIERGGGGAGQCCTECCPDCYQGKVA